MKTKIYHIEVTYQPINKTWGANIKNGNIIANEVDKDLKVALSNLADTILLTEKLVNLPEGFYSKENIIKQRIIKQ